MVEAVNNPAHEERAEFRQWLVLRPGEKLDPKYFDGEQLNMDLTDMF